MNLPRTVYHAIFQGEKFSDMVAHFGGTESIEDDNKVELSEFEDRLVRHTGYKTIGETEEHIMQTLKEDESISFGAIFENGKIRGVLTRHYGLIL